MRKFLSTIISIIILSGVAISANAFTSLKVDFPQGEPQSVIVEYKYSEGTCPLNCRTVKSGPADMPLHHPTGGNVFERYIQAIESELRNMQFSENPTDQPNNYFNLSIRGQNNICHIDLLKNKGDIFIHLNKDGSC